MNSAICTLFEGDYHFGVAILVNSLYHSGFRGMIFAGYRGRLPPWINNLKPVPAQCREDSTYLIAPELSITFVPLETDYHFTNYKPDFMLKLFNEVPAIESIVYLDPDIVVAVPWTHVLHWLSCGVALCEDVNSPLSQNHPKRVAWRRYFAARNRPLTFKGDSYVNGGFIGVTAANRNFLETWKAIQEDLVDEIGSLRATTVPGGFFDDAKTHRMYPFSVPDQDALNCAVEAFEGAASIIGKEAMAFKSGTSLFPHAIGSPKPWNFSLFDCLKNARSPSLVERLFWQEAKGPIRPYPPSKVMQKQIALRIAASLGRFYRRA